MSKSKYPSKIDSQAEIPIARNNIIECGSDIINSIRSAVINIEKTLGINPNGSIGMTVSSRLSKSIDESGNIREDSIKKMGLISGKISDSDVSNNANISESKINLNFPTKVLQSQLTQLKIEVDDALNSLDILFSKFSAHVNENANNSHPASAISTAKIEEESFVSTEKSESNSNVQEILKSIYCGHINLDPDTISRKNSSHTSDQIWVDLSNGLESLTENNDLQSVLDALSGSENSSIIDHQEFFHSSGQVPYEKSSINGEFFLISSEIPVAYGNHSGSDDVFTLITLDTPSDIEVAVGDYVKINAAERAVFYNIRKVTYDSSNLLKSISILGTISISLLAEKEVSFYRKKKNITDSAKILSVPIQKASKNNSDSIQISHPSSPRFSTKNINYKTIDINSDNIKIDVSGSEYELSLFNPSGMNGVTSIITHFNEQAADNNIPIKAYPNKIKEKTEIIFIHDFPNKSKDVYLKIISGPSKLSLNKNYGEKIYGMDNDFVVNGASFSELKIKLSSKASFSSGDKYILSENNPISAGVSVGDIILIYDGNIPKHSAICNGISGDKIEIDATIGIGFDSTENSRVEVYNSAVSIENYVFNTFSKSLAGGIFKVFFNKDNSLFYESICDYEKVYHNNSDLYSIIDSNINQDITFNIKMFVEYGKYYIEIEDSLLEVKELKKNYNFLTEYGNIDLVVNNYNDFKLYIDIQSYVTKGIQFYKYNLNDLEISLFSYNFSNSEFLLNNYGYDVKNTFNEGNVSYHNIDDSVKYMHQEVPHMEKRSNGTVIGLNLLSKSNINDEYVFSIESGVVYFNGKRYTILRKENFYSGISPSSSDKIYIYIDVNGSIAVTSATKINGVCYFLEEGIPLYTIEFYNSSLYSFDLRLDITELDKKVFNPIIVSKNSEFGHFTSLLTALKYAKRISEAFIDFDTPNIKIKSGVYNETIDLSTSVNTFPIADIGFHNALYDAGLWIDFPVIIEGDGDSTVIDISYFDNNYPSREKETHPYQDKNAPTFYIIGSGTAISSKAQSFLPERPSASYLKDKDSVIFKNILFKDVYFQILYNYPGTNGEIQSPWPTELSNDYSGSIIQFHKCSFEASKIFAESYIALNNFRENLNDDPEMVFGNIHIFNSTFNNAAITSYRVDYDHNINITLKDNIFIPPSTFPGNFKVIGMPLSFLYLHSKTIKEFCDFSETVNIFFRKRKNFILSGNRNVGRYSNLMLNIVSVLKYWRLDILSERFHLNWCDLQTNPKVFFGNVYVCGDIFANNYYNIESQNIGSPSTNTVTLGIAPFSYGDQNMLFANSTFFESSINTQGARSPYPLASAWYSAIVNFGLSRVDNCSSTPPFPADAYRIYNKFFGYPDNTDIFGQKSREPYGYHAKHYGLDSNFEDQNGFENLEYRPPLTLNPNLVDPIWFNANFSSNKYDWFRIGCHPYNSTRGRWAPQWSSNPFPNLRGRCVIPMSNGIEDWTLADISADSGANPALGSIKFSFKTMLDQIFNTGGSYYSREQANVTELINVKIFLYEVDAFSGTKTEIYKWNLDDDNFDPFTTSSGLDSNAFVGAYGNVAAGTTLSTVLNDDTFNLNTSDSPVLDSSKIYRLELSYTVRYDSGIAMGYKNPIIEMPDEEFDPSSSNQQLKYNPTDISSWRSRKNPYFSTAVSQFDPTINTPPQYFEGDPSNLSFRASSVDPTKNYIFKMQQNVGLAPNTPVATFTIEMKNPYFLLYGELRDSAIQRWGSVNWNGFYSSFFGGYEDWKVDQLAIIPWNAQIPIRYGFDPNNPTQSDYGDVVSGTTPLMTYSEFKDLLDISGQNGCIFEVTFEVSMIDRAEPMPVTS